MESINTGVSMLTLPISFDQMENIKLIVNDLKFVMKVMEECGALTLVKCGELAKIVKNFMKHI